MDRRDFIESCSKSAACLGAAALPNTMAWAANTQAHEYAKASSLKANTTPR